MGFDAKRTQVAQSAFNFSQYFTSAMSDVVVYGAFPRRVELTAPEGMSTEGGKHARQSITLRAQAQGVPAVTAGWADIPARRAVLRTHGCLLAMHLQRFPTRQFDLDVASYEHFFGTARDLLSACGLEVVVEDQPPLAQVQRAAAAAAVTAAGEPVVGTTTAFAIALVAFVLGAGLGGLVVYARFVGF